MITGSEAESRALMMNAAVRIVATHGFEGFTTKKWALEAGVAEGSLYYHFKSKNDLLEETFFMIDREISDLYSEEDSIPAKSEQMVPFLEDLWKRYYHYLLDNPEKTLYYYRFRTSPRYTDDLQKTLMERYTRVNCVYQKLCGKVGIKSKSELSVMLCYILDTTTMFAFRAVTGGIPHTAKSEREILRLMMHGLGALFGKEF